MNADAARFAAALVRQADGWFAAVEDERARDAFPAVDAFLASPGPLTFLAASRALTSLKRALLVDRVSRRVVDRVFAKGRYAVARVSGVDRRTMESLEGLTADLQAGARLHALAHLMTAYQELAGRTEAAQASLRRQFDAVKAKGPVKRAPPPSGPKGTKKKRRKLKVIPSTT